MSVSPLSLDLESEQLRARRLEAAGTAAALPLQPILRPQGLSGGLSGISSIEKAEEKQAAPQFRPQLEAPKHFMYGLIRTHGELERIADKQTHLFEAQVKRDLEEVDRLDLEKTEKMRKHAESVKSQKTWDAFATVAQYLASGTAIGLGIAAAASGVASVAGGFLIASGVLGLSNRVLRDTGAYQAIAAWFAKSDELQKKIATRLEMGMFFLSLGFGLGGGAWAHSLGALSALSKASAVGKIATGIGVASSVGAAGIRFGMSFSEKKVAQLKADLQGVEAKTNQLFQDMYQNCREVQNLVDTTGDIGDELKQAISASVVHQD